MILCNKRITKALSRLRGRAGWSAPLLFANPRRQVFSCRGPYECLISIQSSGIKIISLKLIILTLFILMDFPKHIDTMNMG